MHAIKKAARKEAWYNNDDPEHKTYNIYGRYDNRRKRQSDVENQQNELRHTQTENAASSPIEEQRRSRNMEDVRGFEGPAHASTMPYNQQPNGKPQPTSLEVPREKQDEIMPYTEGSNSSAEMPTQKDESSGDTLVDQSAGSKSGARRRRFRNHIPFMGKKDEGDDLSRTDTSESKKKKQKFDTSHITLWSQIRAVFGSWINLLLVFVPVGIALAEVGGINGIVIFVINFLAIIPLASILSYGTEELAIYVGEVLGGLLNATFGNAVELIVSIIALTKHEILIVQTSLIGSMLSNLLLVMGMCFFFGGLGRQEQFFNVTVAQTAASLLSLAIGALVIPTAFKIFAKNDSGVAPVSRGTSVLLLITYACYLIFQLRTHVEMYNEPSQKSPKKSRKKSEGDALKAFAMTGASGAAAPAGGEVNQRNLMMQNEEENEGETPQLTKIGALITLGGSTVLVAVCAEFMVGAISDVAASVSPEFIGLILLPIVGNAAEHATAVTVAIKDKMDLAIGVAIGSSLQIALLVLPLMVIINWIGLGATGPKGEDLTLGFDGFQVVVLFIAVIVVNYLIGDGKSHWLEGVMLEIAYLIIAVSAFFYPTTQKLAG